MYCKFKESSEDYEFGVIGRSQEYRLDCFNNYTRFILDHPYLRNTFIEYCKDHNKSICLRGESYGGSIQKSSINPHAKLPHNIAFFSVYLIDERRYANYDDDFYFTKVIAEINEKLLKQAVDKILTPVIFLEFNVPLTKELIRKYSVELEKINGKPFEGVVIKHSKGSFKIINKSYDSLK